MNFYDTLKADPRFNSPNRISDPMLLEPGTRAAVQAIIADAALLGHEMVIFETYRSQARQAALFARAATMLRKVGVHGYGLACDIVKAGPTPWAGDFSFLGPLAKKHGLIWGGDWGAPQDQHTFRDMDHVQRVPVSKQPELFAGDWYPTEDYNPWSAA